MNFDLVVFDMAGTTVLDRGNVNDSFRYAFAESGIKVSQEDVDTVMGYRKIEAIEIILKKYLEKMEYDSALINHIHEIFINNMIAFYKNDIALKALPFAEETFIILQSKGIKVALNTGFTREIADTILLRLGWRNNPLIDIVICSDEVVEGRPHPHMIQAIMQQLQLEDTSRVVKIGDTSVDILEGQFAKCGLVVGITTGAYSHAQLSEYQPDKIIDSLQELPALIA